MVGLVQLLTRDGTALDALDKLKKGSEEANIHARESIRYFDRVQSAAGRRAINGVRIQATSERYASWAECVAATGQTAGQEEPPARIKEILNCAIYFIQHRAAKNDDEVLLLTNDETLAIWARQHGVTCAGSEDVVVMVKKEDIEFVERKRHYDYAQNNSGMSASPTRGGMRSGRGGRGGFVRRDSWKEEAPRGRMDPNGFGRGGRIVRDSSPPDFVLRTPPRGVARGRGKLWEP